MIGISDEKQMTGNIRKRYIDNIQECAIRIKTAIDKDDDNELSSLLDEMNEDMSAFRDFLEHINTNN